MEHYCLGDGRLDLGLGVGFGSTRASNWFAAIISNTGLIGAACMAIFLVQTFARRPAWRTEVSSELLTGLKLSLLPALAMVAVNSAGPDFGPWKAVIFGAIAGIAEFRPQRRSVAADRLTPYMPPDRRRLGLKRWVESAVGVSASLASTQWAREAPTAALNLKFGFAIQQ